MIPALIVAALLGGGVTNAPGIELQQAGAVQGRVTKLNFVATTCTREGTVGTCIPSGLISSTVYTVGTGVAVNDAVYVTGVDTADKADADSVTTGPVIGIVFSKPTATTAYIQYSGELTGFAGLTSGATYFLSQTAGGITATAPTANGTVMQKVGVARNATTLVVNVEPTIIIN